MLGFNEAINSGFEINDSSVTDYYGAYNSATVTRDTTVARPGSVAGTAASMKVVAAPTTALSGMLCQLTNRLHRPGESLVVSTYILGTAGKQVKIRARLLDRALGYVTEAQGERLWTLNGGWQRIWTDPFTYATDYFVPGFAVITNDLLAQTWWMDDWQVEENAVSIYFPTLGERTQGELIEGLSVSTTAYEWNGLILGGIPTNGDFVVEKVSGLLGKPELQTTDQARQDGWGDIPGLQLFKARHIAMDLKVRADTTAIIETYIRNLERVLSITDGQPGAALPLVYRRPGDLRSRFLWAKLEKYEGDSTYDVARRLYTASIMWKCDDPRIYSNDLWQIAFPIADTTSQVGKTVMNAGNTDALPVISIPGPSLNPKVENLDDLTKFVKVTTNVDSGHTLVIDFRAQTAILDGTTDVTTLITTDSLWWKLKSRANGIVYSRDNTAGASSAIMSYRDTWV